MEKRSFHKIIIIFTAMLLAVLFTGLPKQALSQKRQSIEGEGGIFFNSYENECEGRAFYAQFVYTWWLNKYTGLSAGGMFVKGNKLSSFWPAGDKYYTFDDSNIHLNAVGEVKLSLPIVGRFGFLVNARLMFEPFPFDVISYEIYSDVTTITATTVEFPYIINKGNKVERNSRYLFTKFNLSGIINVGLYYDNNTIRISAGYGRGAYDVYNSYKRATIDGHNLEQHIPPNSSRYINNVFLALAVYM